MPKNTLALNEVYGQADEQDQFMDKAYPTLPGLRKPTTNKIGFGPTATGVNLPGSTVSLGKKKSVLDSIPEMSEPVRTGLLKAGLSILAGSGPSALPQSTASIIGKGLLAGVDEYQRAIAVGEEKERLQQLFGLQKQQFGLQKKQFDYGVSKEIADTTKEFSKLSDTLFLQKGEDGKLGVYRKGAYPGSPSEFIREPLAKDLVVPGAKPPTPRKKGKTWLDVGLERGRQARAAALTKDPNAEPEVLDLLQKREFEAAVLPQLGFTHTVMEDGRMEWRTKDGLRPPVNLVEILGRTEVGGRLPTWNPNPNPPKKDVEKQPEKPKTKKKQLEMKRADADDARAKEIEKLIREKKTGVKPEAGW